MEPVNRRVVDRACRCCPARLPVAAPEEHDDASRTKERDPTTEQKATRGEGGQSRRTDSRRARPADRPARRRRVGGEWTVLLPPCLGLAREPIGRSHRRTRADQRRTPKTDRTNGGQEETTSTNIRHIILPFVLRSVFSFECPGRLSGCPRRAVKICLLRLQPAVAARVSRWCALSLSPVPPRCLSTTPSRPCRPTPSRVARWRRSSHASWRN